MLLVFWTTCSNFKIDGGHLCCNIAENIHLKWWIISEA